MRRELLPIWVGGGELGELILPIQCEKVVLEIQRLITQGARRSPIGRVRWNLVVPTVSTQVVYLGNEVGPLIGDMLLVKRDAPSFVRHVLATAQRDDRGRGPSDRGDEQLGAGSARAVRAWYQPLVVAEEGPVRVDMTQRIDQVVRAAAPGRLDVAEVGLMDDRAHVGGSVERRQIRADVLAMD
jgi:hypothetical protein